MSAIIENYIGKSFEVPCPFYLEPFNDFDEDGCSVSLSWRPGIQWENAGPYGEDADARAHGMGKVRYSVVSLHELPRPFPARIFFTRRWIAPDGREFGRNSLRIMTVGQFKRRLRGYKPSGVDQHTNLVVRPLSDEERNRLLGKMAA